MQQPLSGEQSQGLSKTELEKPATDVVRARNIKTLGLAIKLLAGLALLILSIQGIQFNNLVTAIRSTNPGWLILAILAVLLGLGLKLWRWVNLVKNYHIEASAGRLFSAFFVGQAANIVLPLRGGEVIRLGYFTGETKILTEAASTIVLEKYLDLLALTTCGVLVSLKISLDNILNLRGFLLPVAILASLVLLAAIWFGPELWGKIAKRRILPPGMINWLEQWIQASQWLKNPRQVLPAVFITIIIWVVMWVTNLLMFKSLGLPLGGTASGLVLILVYIGLLPALMPGNIGPFYFFARLALVPFGVIHDPAFAFAVVLHAIVTLPAMFGGAAGLLIHSDRPKKV